jgi:hypothetical protein
MKSFQTGAYMHLPNSKAVLVTAFFSGVALLSASAPGIGIAMSQGNIFINSSATAGNATIFDGSTLETQSAVSQVHLNGGAQLRLASDSRGTVFNDHVNLQKGSASIKGYSANANGLNIRADGKASAAISLRDKGEVQIAALTGNVHVFDAAGLNIANLPAGRALELRPQTPGVGGASSLTGCAVKSGNGELLTDEASNVTVQLRGGNAKVGRYVQVTGAVAANATAANGAADVINVTNVKDLGACTASGVPVAGSGGGSPAAIGVVALWVIILIAATGISLGIAAGVGAFSSSNNNISN